MTATFAGVATVPELPTDAPSDASKQGQVDPSLMDAVLDELESVSLERLEAAIGAGAARIAAMQCKWLTLLAEFAKRDGFDRWGCCQNTGSPGGAGWIASPLESTSGSRKA
jgi:hypothetical protein